jgi:hypothetical protein
MTEYPEEVRPQNRGASHLCIEKVSPKIAVDQEHDLSSGQRSDCHKHQKSSGRIDPPEKGNSQQRHPLAAHAKNRCKNIGSSPNAADAIHDKRKRPVIHRVTRRECFLRQRCVCEPAYVRRSSCASQPGTAYEAEVQQHSRKSADPKTEGVQSRKRHVAYAQHERQEVVSEAK